MIDELVYEYLLHKGETFLNLNLRMVGHGSKSEYGCICLSTVYTYLYCTLGIIISKYVVNCLEIYLKSNKIKGKWRNPISHPCDTPAIFFFLDNLKLEIIQIGCRCRTHIPHSYPCPASHAWVLLGKIGESIYHKQEVFSFSLSFIFWCKGVITPCSSLLT